MTAARGFLAGACALLFAGYLLCVNVRAQGTSAPPSISDSNVGYIDNAVPRSRLRFRFDAAFDNPSPNRAEFFWDADGPDGPDPETSADYQDFRAYVEVALRDRFSAFMEVPVRLVNPERNPNTAGLADLDAGFKYALLANCGDYLTLQFRVYAPTGDNGRGLGNGHVSLEPGLLLRKRLSQKATLEAELKGWFPVDGSIVNGEEFAGTILRYGVGLGYDLLPQPCCCCECDCGPRQQLAPVVEVVGWTVLDGLAAFSSDGTLAGTRVVSAAGDTIVNVKLGLRYTRDAHSFYAGYGRALTGAVWYEQVARAEYRLEY